MTNPSSIGNSPRKISPVIIIGAVGVVVVLVAVLLLPQLLASNPPTANPMTARYGDLSTEAFVLSCIDSAFYENGFIWRSCSFELLSEAATEGTLANAMVRYDLETGSVDIHWLFPDLDVTTRSTALLKLADGDLINLRGDNSARYVYRLRQAGGVDALYVPPDLSAIENLEGVAIVGETVQVVFTDATNQMMLRTIPLDGGASTTSSIAGDFACSDETTLCRMEFAYYADAQWHFVALRYPGTAAAGTTPETLSADILVFTATGENAPAPTLADTITLMQGLHYVVGDDGTIVPDRNILDVSASNLTENAIRRTHPFVPEQSPDGAWQLLTLPAGVESAAIGTVNSHYLLAESGLTWLPYFDLDDSGVEYYHWLGETWLHLVKTSDGVKIAPLGEEVTSRPVLTADTTLTSLAAGAQVLLPRAAGGYWYLETPDRYIRLDATLMRVDDR